MSNTDEKKKKEYVDRLYAIERDFLDAKAERDDMVKDLMVEIKGTSEATGVEGKEVKRLAKIRLDVNAAMEKLNEATDDMATHDELYGTSANEDDDDI